MRFAPASCENFVIDIARKGNVQTAVVRRMDMCELAPALKRVLRATRESVVEMKSACAGNGNETLSDGDT